MKSRQSAHSGEFWINFLPRSVALFFGTFALLNLAGNIRAPGFDLNLWWIDLRFLPPALTKPFVVLSACCLISFALRPPRSIACTLVTLACVCGLGFVALLNSVQFYVLLARGTIHAGFPIPLSLLVAAAMALIAASTTRMHFPSTRSRTLFPVVAASLGCLVAFPVLQMLFFGKTDYRRPADVVVVPGARVYADGRPSDALADRVRTACQLYRDGFARKLIFSGGPGDGSVHETKSMTQLALRLGVKPGDILIDDAGLNTQATVKHTAGLLEQMHASRALVVSQFYHLPRLKMAYQRAGLEIYTVPVRENPLWLHPYNVVREVPALWVYYFRPLMANLANHPNSKAV